MKSYFITETAFGPFVESMLAAGRVVGPVARRSKFVFQELATSADLRLDYDVTILPPRKVFFPQRQKLIEFSPEGVKSCIDPVPTVLFGVHFYDIKAIDMLDELFRSGHEDRNYLANREATTIVGGSVQTVSSRAFWASMGAGVEPKGHDAFVTRVPGGWVFETRTAKGEKLLAHGEFASAAPERVAEAARVNSDVLGKCPERMPGNGESIAQSVRSAFKNEDLWKEISASCFSCGTCNTVCPTCYCFDVQDTWNIDQVSGARTRQWDGCLLEDFAMVSLGAGKKENFREGRCARFRHRAMRKLTYLNSRLGTPACVGCGRCSAGCVPDIADPVRIVVRIMEG